jgi:hypothetical protein
MAKAKNSEQAELQAERERQTEIQKGVTKFEVNGVLVDNWNKPLEETQEEEVKEGE